MVWNSNMADVKHFPFFSTGLMRASSDNVRIQSIEGILHKYRFYMLSLGDENTESYWQIGTEFLTLYADSAGFRVLPNSKLELSIGSLISEFDWTLFHDKYMKPSPMYMEIRWTNDLGMLRKELIKNAVLPNFSDYKKWISEITPLSVSIFRVHTEVDKIYLEKI